MSQTDEEQKRKSGDQIHADIGDDVRGAAVGKNIIQIGTLRIPYWVVTLIVVVAIVIAALAGVTAYYGRRSAEGTEQTAALLAATATPTAIPTPTPSPTPTPLPVKPAAEDETLILIATFHNTAKVNTEAHNKIKRAIEEELDELHENSIRVEVEPTILEANDHVHAKELGTLYDANIVIWGEDTGVEVYVIFLNLRQPDFYNANIKIRETERSQLANPSAYSEFITTDLPNQLTFLSLYALGQTAYSKEEYKLAIRQIEAATDAATEGAVRTQISGGVLDGLARAYLDLGRLYSEIGNTDAAEEEYIAAFELYDQAIQINPEDADGYNGRGNVRIGLGDLDAAVTDYDQAIALNPSDASAFYNRGFARHVLGDLDAAILDYDQAIALNPDDASASYINRGFARYRLGDLDAAILDYDQAIALNPENAIALYFRGLAHYRQGDLEAAIADYDQVIALDPDAADAFYTRGFARHGLGDLDAAILDYDQAIALNPENAIALYFRGVAHYRQGDLEAAIVDYDQVIALDPDDAGAFYNRGFARHGLGDLEAAIADYDQAIALNPDDADAFHFRGVAHYKQGDLEAAIADYEQAIALEPESAFAHNNLCLTYSLNQQADLAINHCNRAIELVPFPGFADSRGLANALLGNYEAAIADFQIYVDWLTEQNDEASFDELEERKAWIAALEQGENPFTPEVLEELRTE